jgi:hypothetical protein
MDERIDARGNRMTVIFERSPDGKTWVQDEDAIFIRADDPQSFT